MTLNRPLLLALVVLPLAAHAEPHRLTKVVEFDYEKAHVHAKQREALQDVAKEWKAHPEMTVVVEGHAFFMNEEDSISLGQHRADVVRGLLIKFGVNPANITAVDNSRVGEPGRYVDLVLEVR